jgi:hypothetical protein
MLDGTRFGSLPKATGTSDQTVAGDLVDSEAQFDISVSRGDVVMNTSSGGYALVSRVDSESRIALSQDIITSGQTYEIYESGGTVNGEGHFQRDWLVTSLNSSHAKWKFIVSELPFLHDEAKGTDKWADYDPLSALRTYLVNHVTAPNVIWIGADGHFSALDDGSHPDDPWPSVACGNLSGTYGKDPAGTWLVNGQSAEWSADDGASGGFALLKVRSDRVEIELYGQGGLLVNNGVIDLELIVPLSFP